LPDPYNIALDATYSIGGVLSGVGLYSDQILTGLAAAHPEVRFDFCYRPHRYLRACRALLPPNARRRLLAEPFDPAAPLSFTASTNAYRVSPCAAPSPLSMILFVMTGTYSTPEFRARFTAQAPRRGRPAEP